MLAHQMWASQPNYYQVQKKLQTEPKEDTHTGKGNPVTKNRDEKRNKNLPLGGPTKGKG